MKKCILILFIGLPFLLQAQTDSSLSYWDLTLHFGPYLSGVPINIEEKMQANGFRKNIGGFWGSTSGNSMDMTEGNGIFSLGIERITAKAWSYKLAASILNGQVSGLSDRYGELTIKYSQVSTSFLAGYHSKQRITRVALGPSLHFTTLKTVSYSSAAPLTETNTKAGFAVEAGFRVPAKSRFFFDFNIQYQFVGKQDLGTYKFSEGDMVIGESSSSYLCFNFGIGLRFGKALK